MRRFPLEGQTIDLMPYEIVLTRNGYICKVVKGRDITNSSGYIYSLGRMLEGRTGPSSNAAKSIHGYIEVSNYPEKWFLAELCCLAKEYSGIDSETGLPYCM